MFLRCLPKGPKNSGICHKFVKSRDTRSGPKRHHWCLCSQSSHTQSLPQLSLMSQKQGSATLLLLTFPCLQHICLCACILLLLGYAAGFAYLLFLQDSRFYYSSSKKEQLAESGNSNANSKARQRS